MAEGVAQTQPQPQQEGFMQYPMQRPSAYPPVLPVSSENQDQQANQGYAKGGVAHAAERTRQMGRGQDTMLVHMTPNEVNSLQGLAMSMGGSLTINPDTGLPEAGWLGKLLPTILGFGLNFIPGVGPLAAAGIVAAGQTAITGDLRKGLMAGLGAYGGASLAGAVAPTATANLGTTAAGTTVGGGAGKLVAENAAKMATESAAVEAAKQGVVAAGTDVAAKTAAEEALKKAIAGQVTKAPGFLAKFGAEAAGGLGTGMLAKAAPMAAGLGLLGGVSNAFSPTIKNQEGAVDNSYRGPYTAQKRTATFAPSTDDILASTAERDYFDIDQPEVYNMQGQIVQPGSQTPIGTPILQSFLNPNAKKNDPMYSFREVPYGLPTSQPTEEELRQLSMRRGMFGLPMGYAPGGEVHLADGAFVVDARTVSELGNGSSSAGQELLARMGGRPVRGPGDGVSDSVPARIGRDQPARVARDEVIFGAEAVRKLGKGSQKRGAQKLYAMVDKAHKARKKAGRGEDTKLRRGLA